MQPEDLNKRIARKITDNGVSQYAIPRATLGEAIVTNDKLDELTQAVKDIPKVEVPETIIPEYPSTIEVSNLPEVQKVEVINPPNEKDDTEVKNLLKELLAEVKKKKNTPTILKLTLH